MGGWSFLVLGKVGGYGQTMIGAKMEDKWATGPKKERGLFHAKDGRKTQRPSAVGSGS